MAKTILITGTSAGLGKAMALTLAKDGHRVIAAMRNVSSKNAGVAKELGALPNIDVVEIDVTSEESFSAAITTVVKKYGQLDVLVNNAGIFGMGIIEGTHIETMKKIFDTNLWGTVRGYQAVLPHMREKGAGLIVNISSGFGLFSAPYTTAYNMTKFAMQALTEGIRHEIKRFGIETVGLLPGPFPTEVATKGGYGQDKQDIIDAYGQPLSDTLEAFGAGMFGKMQEYDADPQEVADALRDLINLKDGTRPVVTIVNRMGEGIEKKYADSKDAPYVELMKKVGIGAVLS